MGLRRLARLVDVRAALYAIGLLLATLPFGHGKWSAAAVAVPPTTDFAAALPRLVRALGPTAALVPFVFLRPPRPTWWRVGLGVASVAAIAIDLHLGRAVLSPYALAATVACALADLDERPRMTLALLVAALGLLLVREVDANRALRLATIAVSVLAALSLALHPRWIGASIAAAIAARWLA
ncbi:MAG: hypothetical protein U0270_26740 [Labilithrix sp.]